MELEQDVKINLKESQLRGAIFVALSALFIPAVFFFYQEYFRSVPTIPWGNQCQDCIAVEIEGNIKEKGIYFIPAGKRLADLLTMLNLNHNSAKRDPANPDLFRVLNDGIRITMLPGKNERPAVKMEGMMASTRLAMNRPVDVNSASLEDLVLVPGIGEKTAEKIIKARNTGGKFRKLEDLMKIKGIKKKRLGKLRPYLYVKNI